MDTIIYWVLLSSGQMTAIEAPMGPIACVQMHALGRIVSEGFGTLEFPEGPVVRFSCGGKSVVTMLPASAGVCELEPST